jgi:hypothetical protein
MRLLLKKTIDKLYQIPEKVTNINDDEYDLDGYADYIKTNQSWGSDTDLTILSYILDIPFYYITIIKDENTKTMIQKFGQKYTEKDYYTICNIGSSHYVLKKHTNPRKISDADIAKQFETVISQLQTSLFLGGSRVGGGKLAKQLMDGINEVLARIASYQGPSESQAEKEEAIRALQRELAGGPGAWDITVWTKLYLYKLFVYLPNALIMFGPIVDSINQEFRYTIASIIGILSILVNKLIGGILVKIFKPDASSFFTEKIRNCFIPGFDFLESRASPQAIVLPTAIFMYLLIDLGKRREASQNVGTAFLMLGFLAIQAFVLYMNGCFRHYIWQSSIVAMLVAFAIGTFCGGMGWVGVNSLAPDRLPSAGEHFTSETPIVEHMTGNPIRAFSKTGEAVDAAATCAPPNDQDQFVCEAYRDGEVVTSTLVA